jgi:hypothetical protein
MTIFLADMITANQYFNYKPEQLFISDSLCYEIETEDVYKDMREMVDLLDTSNYVEDLPLFSNKNKKKRLKLN